MKRKITDAGLFIACHLKCFLIDDHGKPVCFPMVQLMNIKQYTTERSKTCFQLTAVTWACCSSENQVIRGNPQPFGSCTILEIIQLSNSQKCHSAPILLFFWNDHKHLVFLWLNYKLFKISTKIEKANCMENSAFGRTHSAAYDSAWDLSQSWWLSLKEITAAAHQGWYVHFCSW